MLSAGTSSELTSVKEDEEDEEEESNEDESNDHSDDVESDAQSEDSTLQPLKNVGSVISSLWP